AASAVASPTAKTGWSRKRGISGAKASTPLGLVRARTATASGEGAASRAPGRGASVNRGATSGVKPSAVSRSAVRAAPGSARVTQTRRIGVMALERDLLVAGDGLDLTAEIEAQGAGVCGIGVCWDVARAGPAARPVRAEHFGAEVQTIALNVGVGADGGAAGAFQRRHGPALGGDGEGGGGVVQGAGPGGVDVALARLQGQGALTRRGQEGVQRQALTDDLAEAETVEARTGQQDGVEVAVALPLQPGVDVAAQHFDVQVGTQGQRLRLTTQGGGAEAGALQQVGEGGVMVADEGVAGVFALRHGGDGQTGGLFGGDVLHRVDGDVDAAVQQGFLDLLGEQGLAADFQQAAVLDAVAGGDDLDQRNKGFDLGVGHAQGAADGALHHAGLGQGQARTSGADAQERLSHV